MRNLVAVCSLALVLGACAGKEEGSPSDGPQDLDCSSVPVYELEGLDCDQLANAFDKIAAAARTCSGDSDCEVLHPPCEHWHEVGCYEPVNACFTVELLSRFEAESEGCNVIGTMTFEACSCDAPPAVRCEEGLCSVL